MISGIQAAICIFYYLHNCKIVEKINCHDAAHEVIKAAEGRFPQLSYMLHMKSPKLTEDALLSCHDAAHDVIKAAGGCLAKTT
jgi:hypothetical protein